MLLNGFDTPLHLRRKPSRVLLAYLIVIHLLAALALLSPIAVQGIAYFTLWLLLVVSIGYHFNYYQTNSHDDTGYWIWQTDSTWVRATGDANACRLTPARTVSTPWFVLVTLRGPAQQQRLLIVYDQVAPDTYRRLRVRLKMYYEEAAAGNEDAV